ncbi:prephenate dehydrogenase/arogenate dehydrogenase family protein [bacterium]|nr:prephenate dehydrogenase/arogenate dehydrogenase family protein [bacterium]
MSGFRSALVLGTGLLGTSFALALAKRGLASLIAGHDPDPRARAAAEARGAFSYIEPSLEKALATGELVVLAAPPRAVRDLLPRVAARGTAGRLVIDVASTKALIVLAAERAFADTASAFVGGHPMAGAPSGGAGAAHADLFQNAPFALCPSSVSPPEALERARALVLALGARPLIVDARAHDAAVARISALPHLAAAAVALAAGEAPDATLAEKLAAAGFRSTTRVAAGGRALWTQVLLENRDEVLASVASLKEAVGVLEDALRRSDEEALGEALERARSVRSRLAGDADAARVTLADQGGRA